MNNISFYGTNYLKGEEEMDKEIEKMLEEEIEGEIRSLSTLEPGKEKSAAIGYLAELCRLKNEERAKKERVWDRYFRLATESASLVLPLIFYAVWMRRGFKFEETGTYTSTTFRGLFNRFRPTK
jgi:hypothetical protein